MLTQTNEARVYSVVMLNPRGPDSGVVSRAIGTDLDLTLDIAEQRRGDFPNAELIRVIATGHGIVAEF